eukprot:scaffold29017_cov66-Cyclotella_meneghiniana.AAC.1
MQNANKALINAAKGALNEESRDALTNLFVGTADRNFFLFFDRLYTKWGKATPVDIKKNNDNILTSSPENTQNGARSPKPTGPGASLRNSGPTHSAYGLKHPELRPPWVLEATLKKSPTKKRHS